MSPPPRPSPRGPPTPSDGIVSLDDTINGKLGGLRLDKVLEELRNFEHLLGHGPLQKVDVVNEAHAILSKVCKLAEGVGEPQNKNPQADIMVGQLLSHQMSRIQN